MSKEADFHFLEILITPKKKKKNTQKTKTYREHHNKIKEQQKRKDNYDVRNKIYLDESKKRRKSK